MIVVHVEFDYVGDQRDEFQAWLLGFIAQYRREPGCLGYDLLIDPQDPNRHVIIEVWAHHDALEAHAIGSAHIEQRALTTLRWGVRDLRVRFWRDAGEMAESVIHETHQPVPGRDVMNQRIAELLADR